MKLKEWREGVGRSVESIARELGCTRQTVYRYEAGRLPDAECLEKILALTGGQVSPNDWFTISDYPAASRPVVGAAPAEFQ